MSALGLALLVAWLVIMARAAIAAIGPRPKWPAQRPRVSCWCGASYLDGRYLALHVGAMHADVYEAPPVRGESGGAS